MRELVRQAYLLSALILTRPLMERTATISYLVKDPHAAPRSRIRCRAALGAIPADRWMMAGMKEDARTPRPPLRRLLTNAGYRRLWAARTVSQWGDVAQFTTLGLLLFSLTGSGLGVSGAVVAEIIPVLLLAPVAGALVDRLPRVRVMVGADLARVVFAGTLAIWHEDATVAYLVAAGLSAGAVFFNPAASSILPSLVQEDELVAANSGIWTAAVTSQVLLAPCLVPGLVEGLISR